MHEDGCNKEVLSVVSWNWEKYPCHFKLVLTLSVLLLCLCYPGEYLRLGTLISCNLAHVLEACDCLKLLSIYFNLRVDAAGVVCHQLGLLGTDLHTVGCGGFVWKTHWRQVSLPLIEFAILREQSPWGVQPLTTNSERHVERNSKCLWFRSSADTDTGSGHQNNWWKGPQSKYPGFIVREPV